MTQIHSLPTEKKVILLLFNGVTNPLSITNSVDKDVRHIDTFVKDVLDEVDGGLVGQVVQRPRSDLQAIVSAHQQNTQKS